MFIYLRLRLLALYGTVLFLLFDKGCKQNNYKNKILTNGSLKPGEIFIHIGGCSVVAEEENCRWRIHRHETGKILHLDENRRPQSLLDTN